MRKGLSDSPCWDSTRDCFGEELLGAVLRCHMCWILELSRFFQAVAIGISGLGNQFSKLQPMLKNKNRSNQSASLVIRLSIVSWIPSCNYLCIRYILGRIKSIFLYKRFIYMEGREREIYHWFIYQMATTIRYGPARRQEPGIPSGFPIWVVGIQVLEPWFAPIPGCEQGAGSEIENPGLEPTFPFRCWHCRPWLNLLYHSTSPKLSFLKLVLSTHHYCTYL